MGEVSPCTTGRADEKDEDEKKEEVEARKVDPTRRRGESSERAALVPASDFASVRESSHHSDMVGSLEHKKKHRLQVRSEGRKQR